MVVNFSNNEKAALETTASIERSGGTAVAIRADVSKVAENARLFATAVEHFGRLDINVRANTSSTTAGSSTWDPARRDTMPGLGVYGGSKIPGQYFVEVLAKELGHRGVTVNSILPTAIEGAGIFSQGVDASYRDAVKSYRPMARMGSVHEVADAAEYFASDLSAFVSGQHLLLSGGANR